MDNQRRADQIQRTSRPTLHSSTIMDPPRSSLCPGYTQVASFSPHLSSPRSNNAQLDHDANSTTPTGEIAEDEEYEEEIEYVVLDLGNIEPTLVPSSNTYRLIGLDTPTPFLQLSGTVLRGRHENLLGSELVFTDDKDTSTGQKKRGVTHVSTTSKRIAFKEVQLRPREESVSLDPEQSPEVDDGAVPVEEDFDGGDSMDVDDDALEYVDLNIDPLLRQPPNQPLAGPSCLPSIPVPSRSPSPPTTIDPSAPISSFISSVAVGKGKAKALSDVSASPADVDVEETPGDPMLRIDRLTGISPPLTRAPRGSKKAGVVPATGSEGGSTVTTAKGKAKEDGDGMDTTES